MYIKIKHLKQFFLISACVFFAGFNYLNNVQADINTKVNSKSCDKTLDSDCDGLINSEETLYGTNPQKADSDNDGYSDGVEVKSGYDPLKPAPDDRIIHTDDTEIKKQLANTEKKSQTSEFVQEIESYTSANGDQPIASTDIQNLMSASMEKRMGTSMTWESLSVNVDISQIKISKQDYSKLSTEKKKEQLLQDAYKYVSNIEYLLRTNSPIPMLEDEDLPKFLAIFNDKLLSLSGSSPDIEYFTDLGNRLEKVSKEISDVEVPETMLPIHIKFISLLHGILLMKELPSPKDDPMATVILFSKIQNLINLGSDFFQNDFQDYFKSI